MIIIDKQTGETIGRVITNHSMTTGEAMELAGFRYIEGNDTGWTRDGITFYDESSVEIKAE